MTDQRTAPKASSQSHPVISVADLKVHFPIHKGVLGRTVGHVKAVDGVSFDIRKKEVFALVGESGCGKTTTAQAVLGLNAISAGTINLALGPWRDAPVGWQSLSGRQRRELRRHIQVVFQDPFSSLDPRMTVRQIIEEPLLAHRLGDRDERMNTLLRQIGLNPSILNRYPHEFSGGQRQRIGIARALATRPDMIVADEPVSALDVSIQAQIVNLLQDLQAEYSLTILFISHDLAVVRHIANRLAVMYLGRIMEIGDSEQLFNNPLHPYTHLLLDSIPVPGKGRRARQALPPEEKGQPGLTGCPFYPRCKQKTPRCLEAVPQLKDRGDGHAVACVHYA